MRFQKPKLLLEKAWEGIFDGSGQITPCVQFNPFGIFSSLKGSEDCLHLNVYVPQTEEIPEDGFIIDLVVVYDNSMVSKFGSEAAAETK